GDAGDWFLDNKHSFSTWTSFIEKIVKIFKLPGNDDNLFDQLCLSEHVNKKNDTTTIDIIAEDTSMHIGSGKADYDPPVPEQFSETNRIIYETKEKPLNPINDASFNVLSFEKSIPDDINVVSDGLDVFKNFGMKNYDSIIATGTVFIGIQYSLNMHNEPMITEIRRQANIKTTTQMILLKIKIVFDKKIYNNILNTYWFMNQPFDPGGVVSVKQAFVLCLDITYYNTSIEITLM
ncbi:unnamed protein product, partial [Rotaria magnacalcarata]